jgi:hypothetical protein
VLFGTGDHTTHLFKNGRLLLLLGLASNPVAMPILCSLINSSCDRHFLRQVELQNNQYLNNPHLPLASRSSTALVVCITLLCRTCSEGASKRSCNHWPSNHAQSHVYEERQGEQATNELKRAAEEALSVAACVFVCVRVRCPEEHGWWCSCCYASLQPIR